MAKKKKQKLTKEERALRRREDAQRMKKEVR